MVGVPFDAGVSYRPGARFGPAAVRAASRLLRPYHPGLDVDPFALPQVADAGDVVPTPSTSTEAIAPVEAGADELSGAGARLVALGGDHTLALPLLRAVAKQHGPLAVVHFDAHLDTWDTYFGAPYTHGTPFRRASEEGLSTSSAASTSAPAAPCTAADLDADGVLGFQVIRADDYETAASTRSTTRLRDAHRDRPGLRLGRHRRPGPRRTPPAPAPPRPAA